MYSRKNEIKLDKIFKFEISEYTFGELTKEELVECYKDGRVASHFLERHLTKWFPELIHVKGCKDHDHVDKEGIKYDAKNFTSSSGLKFKPSAMIGTGRVFDAAKAHKKADDLVYICCDIVDFPKVRVLFKKGSDLVIKYPKCEVPRSKREDFFGQT
jgi:hypothetical protein